MREYKFTVRQACFFYIAFCAVSKTLFLTAVITLYADRYAWLSVLLNYAANGLIIFSTLLISERFPGKDLYGILEYNLGKPFAKTLFALFALFLFLSAFVPVIEQKQFIQRTLYDNSPMLLPYFPFFIFSAYFCYLGLKAVARCSDIFIWVTAAGIVGLLALTFPNVDLTELLPLKTNAASIFSASAKSALWHTEGLYSLFLIGGIKGEKLAKTKIMSAFSISAALSVIYVASIYCEFGPLTVRQIFPPVKMGMFSVALINIGRIDYVFAIMLAASNLFSACLPLVFSTMCVGKVFGLKDLKAAAIIINAISYAVILYTEKNFVPSLHFLENYYLYPLMIVTVLPLSVFIFVKGRSNNEKIRT
ncbi:MAG: GerAB/ArcD/ProY family transporter [Clostridia bacterium]|nr:GerAB/ArcD/ProY family transporter [Clostridia bacterium]